MSPGTMNGMATNFSWDAFDPREMNAKNNFAGQQADLNRQMQERQGNADRAAGLLQTQLAGGNLALQQSKWNAVSPLMQSLAGGSAGGGPVGGTAGPQPGVTTGPVWNDGQIQGQVNQTKANNAQQAATAQNQNAAKTAGQGFGGNSPLLAALNGQTQAARMASDAAGEQGIRWNAAQGNAQQQLATEKQAATNWMDYQQQDIQRRQAANSYNTSLLSALAGFI